MDESELKVQLERHHPAAYGWAMSCCANSHIDAEDVLQAAYLKVLDGRARFGGSSAFKTWFFAVIRMTAKDQKRRSWLRRLRLAEYPQPSASRDQQPEQERIMEQSEKMEAFRKILANLPARQQEVLHLVFYQDMSLSEAAEVMAVSLGSARTHYERGKSRLREWLMKSEVFDE
jgi:RNA polymerase sigma-70 factor (ECF subfamily)